MASNKAVFTIVTQVLNKGKGFGMLKGDLEAFQKELASAIATSRQFKPRIINFTALAMGFQGVTRAVNQLNQCFSQLTAAYSAQIEAETQLGQVMSRTMSATEADVQAIKDLCSAQQALGVVGDEVQLAGAQELATYISKRETLEKLIPAMNDMVAQQYGYNATAQSAVSIATMLGKVMNGQTSALSRYGYSFNEIQANILKTGTEAERAAVLFEVIEESVGGVNEALANTTMGAMKQFSNALGDHMETMGSWVVKAMPVITALSSITMGLAGAGQLIASLKACQGIIAGVNVKLLALKGMALLSGQSLATITAGANASAVSLRSAAAACGTLKLALRGLAASTIIGVAIVAISYAVEKLFTALTSASDAANKLTAAERQAQQASERNARAIAAGNNARDEAAGKIELYIARLESAAGSQRKEQSLVAELNTTYGQIFGTYQTAAQWLETLRENSEKYCRQLEIQAQLQAMSANIAELEANKRDLFYNADGSAKNLSSANEVVTTITPGRDQALGMGISTPEITHVEIPDSSPLAQANAEKARIEREQEAIRARMRELASEISSDYHQPQIGASQGTEGVSLNVNARTLAEIEGNIKYYRQQLQGATVETAAAINAEIDHWQSLSDAIRKATDMSGADYARELAGSASFGTTADVEVNAKEPELEPLEIKEVFDAGATTLGAIETNISILRASLQDMTAEQAAAINDQIDHWETLADAIRNATNKQADAGEKLMKTGRDVSSAFSMMGSAISGIGSATDDAAGAWLDYAGNLLGNIGQMIQAILALAHAKGISASQDVKFPLNIIALAATTAAVTAAALKVPKFAAGGIAYGPTLGLFGEYGGASNNPEVVAPLDRLRDLIGPTGASLPETITLRVSGPDLVAVVNTRLNHLARR
jgi:hypothetical protein